MAGEARRRGTPSAETLRRSPLRYQVTSTDGWSVLVRLDHVLYTDDAGELRFSVGWDVGPGVSVVFGSRDFVDLPGRDGAEVADRIRRSFAFAGWRHRGLDGVERT